MYLVHSLPCVQVCLFPGVCLAAHQAVLSLLAAPSLSIALRRVNNHHFLSTFYMLDADHSTLIIKVI